jgi:hypothetical protein
MNSEQTPLDSTPPQEGKAPAPWIAGIESYTREQPTKAVSAAFGAGLILALVPVGGVLRLLFSALRPVLLILGIVKIWEEVDSRRQTQDASQGTDSPS